jgi:hypothetical protein
VPRAIYIIRLGEPLRGERRQMVREYSDPWRRS